MPRSLRLAVAEFRDRPGRALLPGVALVVGVACLLAGLMLSDAMVRAVGGGAPIVPAGVDLVVRAEPYSDADLDQAAADRVAAVPGVTGVRQVRQVRVDLLLDGRAGERRATADVEVAGAERVPVLEGRTPGPDGEIAVDRVTAHQHGLAPGSLTRVADAAGDPVEVVVRGVTRRGAVAEEPVLVVGEGLAARLGTSRVLSLHVTGGDRAAVAAAAGGGFRVDTAARVAAERPDQDLAVVLLPFSVLALATSVFVASATYRAVYLQRQRNTALLRCLGAFRGSLVRANLIEAVLMGAVAGAVGALLGGAVAWLLARLFDATGLSVVLGAVELDPAALPTGPQLLVGVVTATALSGFAAVRPSLTASLVPPLAALRTSEGQAPDQAVVRRRRVFGLVLVGVAAVLAALGVLAQGSLAAIFLVLFSGITAVFGLFGVLGPVVVPGLGRVFGSVASRFGGAQWKLAAAEVRRVPQRSASVAMPLLLAAAMVTFFAVTVGSAQRLEQEFDDRPRPDAVVSDAGGRPLDGAAGAAAIRPGVAGGVVLHGVTAEQRDADGYRFPVRVAGAEPDQARDYLAARDVAVDVGDGDLLVSAWYAERTGARVGEPLTVGGLPGGALTGRVAGTFGDDLMDGFDVVVADPDLAPPTHVLVAFAPGTDPEAYAAAVEGALTGSPTVLVATEAARGAQDQRYLDLGITMLMVLLGLSVAVAVTGIGTALTISVQERRKELALRRALGVTRGGIQGGVVAEAVLLSLVGVLGGGLFGLVYAELALAAVGLFVWPTAAAAPLVLGGAGVVALAVLAALGPARNASRTRPAAGLAAG